MRARVVAVSILLALSPACSLSRSALGAPTHGDDAALDAHGIDAFRPDGGPDTGIDANLPDVGIDVGMVDAGEDAGIDANLPDTGMPDAGVDAFVPPIDSGVDAVVPPIDSGTDAFVPPVDSGTDAFVPPIDSGTDAFVPPVDSGTDAFVPPVDAGTDAFVPPVDAGSDGGPCALCSGAQMCCSLTCVDTTNDVNHCGSCSACAAVPNAMSSCVTSTCTVASCIGAFGDCNGMYADGCETTLGTTTNCVSCGDACASYTNTTSSCGATGCTYACTAGFGNCNSTSPDCETTLGTTSNCLSCGDVCTSYANTTSSCGATGCAYACTTGYANCNGAAPDCETHTDTDALNCGACGHACHTGQTCTAGACHGWGTISSVSAPSGRSQHTAVWTGSVMIVWGGTNGVELNTGARYDPATDTWTATSTTGAPGARRGHAAVWTGTRMLVWGGYRGGTGWLNDGGLYDPATDTWSPLPGTAPAARSRFAYAWDDVDNDFFIFGGWDATSVRGDGAIFNGTTWSATSGGSAPSARRYTPALWTGTRFLVWGGEQATGADLGAGTPTTVLQDGGRYDPVGNTWTNMTNSGRPAGRSRHLAVWTGTQMVVWSGYDAAQTRLTSGGRYTLSSNTWTATSAPPIGGRISATAVYTGSAMLVWGGTDVMTTFPFGTTYLADGAAYTPSSDAWATITTTGAPTGRADHSAVWDGTEMILWGGINGTTSLADGAVYAP